MTKKIKRSPEEQKQLQESIDAYTMKRAEQLIRAHEEEERVQRLSKKLDVFSESEIDPGLREAPKSWLDFETADQYEIAKGIGSAPAKESLVLPSNTSMLTQAVFNEIKSAADPQNVADILVKYIDDFLQQDEQVRIELTQILMAAYKKLLLLFPDSDRNNDYNAVEIILDKIRVGSIIEDIFTEDYGKGAEPENIIRIRDLFKGITQRYIELNPGKHYVRKGNKFYVETYDPNTKSWKTNTIATSVSSTSSSFLTIPGVSYTNPQQKQTSSGRVLKKVQILSVDEFRRANTPYTSRIAGEVNEVPASTTFGTISPRDTVHGPKGRRREPVDPKQIPTAKPKPPRPTM